jgi:hypothetical protein
MMDIYDQLVEQGVVQVCRKCGLEKPIPQFHKKASVRCGVERFCKECKSKYNAERYQKDPLVKLSVKVFRFLHPDRPREISKKYYKKNRGAIRLKAQQKYLANQAKES